MKLLKNCLWFFRYISWLYRYLKLILGYNSLKDIKIISIEFASICNLHCKYCGLEKHDRSKYLDINIYEKLIKEICENPKFNIKVMEWPVSGEFFIYPDYKKVIEITQHYIQEYPNFQPYIILNDNLLLMNEDNVDLVLKAGIIKQIICSIDGHDAESFERMRPPAKFARILENMRILVKRNKELGKPVTIQVNNGRDNKLLKGALSTQMKEVFNMADSVRFWQPQYLNESFNKPNNKFLPAKGFCTFVFNNVTLLTSGFMSKCCMDLKGSTAYADFTKDSLKNIWHSNTRRQFLVLMFRGLRRLLKGCERCSITSVNNDNRCVKIF